MFPLATFLADTTNSSSNAGAWVCLIVGGMVVLSIVMAFLDKPIRCNRCGFRAKKSRFRGGRCPKCDSYEL